MEVLRELLRIVTSKSDSKRVFPELYEAAEEDIPSTLRGAYLHGVIHGTFKNDTEAAEHLYGVPETDVRYRVLKSRAIDRAVHAVLLMQIKTPEHSEYLSNYYKCTRNLIASQTLLRFASRPASEWLARKTLAIAKKYHFTDICLPLTLLLRDTAAYNRRRRLYDHLDSMVQYYEQVYSAESKGTAILDRLNMSSASTHARSSDLVVMADKALKAYQEITMELQSHVITLNRVRLAIACASIKEDHNELIRMCDEGIEYLKSNPHLSQPARLGEFRLDKMITLVLLRKPDVALQDAAEISTSFARGGRNWFLVYQFLTVASMLNQEFERARRYLVEATTHRRLAFMTDQEKQEWILFGAYLYLAQLLNLYEPDDLRTFQNFRLSTFLNSVPELTKEMKVDNAMVLIAQICFLIAEADDDAAERRIEYLKVYVSRYMREKEFIRIRIFMRMLQTFPRVSFDAKEIAKRNERHIQELQEHAKDFMGQHVNEYIPFEVLHDGILNVIRARVYAD